MKKFFTLLCSLALCGSAMAQTDTREPGIYNVDGDQSIPLTFQMGINKKSVTSYVGVLDISKQKVSYKGENSDTSCQTSEFVLVIDLEKKHITQTLKKNDIFVKSMTPDNMILIPLYAEGGKRIYDQGRAFNGISFNRGRQSIEFEWEQISDNSFRISAELVPGEYAFVFKPAKLGNYDYQHIYDFTIAR